MLKVLYKQSIENIDPFTLLSAIKKIRLQEKAGAACHLDVHVSLSHHKLLCLSHLFASSWRYQALPSCWARARCWQPSSWRCSSPNSRQRVPRRARSSRGATVWQEHTPTRRFRAATRTSSLFWRTALCDCVTVKTFPSRPQNEWATPLQASQEIYFICFF